MNCRPFQFPPSLFINRRLIHKVPFNAHAVRPSPVSLQASTSQAGLGLSKRSAGLRSEQRSEIVGARELQKGSQTFSNSPDDYVRQASTACQELSDEMRRLLRLVPGVLVRDFRPVHNLKTAGNLISQALRLYGCFSEAFLLRGRLLKTGMAAIDPVRLEVPRSVELASVLSSSMRMWTSRSMFTTSGFDVARLVRTPPAPSRSFKSDWVSPPSVAMPAGHAAPFSTSGVDALPRQSQRCRYSSRIFPARDHRGAKRVLPSFFSSKLYSRRGARRSKSIQAAFANMDVRLSMWTAAYLLLSKGRIISRVLMSRLLSLFSGRSVTAWNPSTRPFFSTHNIIHDRAHSLRVLLWVLLMRSSRVETLCCTTKATVAVGSVAVARSVYERMEQHVVNEAKALTTPVFISLPPREPNSLISFLRDSPCPLTQAFMSTVRASGRFLSRVVSRTATPVSIPVRHLTKASHLEPVSAGLSLHTFKLVFPIDKIAAFFKSSKFLRMASTSTRLSFGLLPLAVRNLVHSVLLYFNSRFAPFVQGSPFMTWPLSMALLGVSFVLLCIAYASNMEQTPITGRSRLMPLSQDEELNIMLNTLLRGWDPETDVVDWALALQKTYGDVFSSTSPLGGKILDSSDWRYRWARSTLDRLEGGVAAMLANEPVDPSILQPPAPVVPLQPRLASPQDHVAVDYDLLVIDKPVSNAFAFGFAPDGSHPSLQHGQGRRGVIVLFTGFVNEILGLPLDAQPGIHVVPVHNSDGTVALKRSDSPSPYTLPPSGAIAPKNTEALAVLLSHELSHLILSHTLETFVKMQYVRPWLMDRVSDVLHALVYPLTCVFGPAVSLNAHDIWHNSPVRRDCFTRCDAPHLESEADIVGLRLLAHSGIDPRAALPFWSRRLTAAKVADRDARHLRLTPKGHHHYHGSSSDELRVRNIVNTLFAWFRLSTVE